MAPPDGKTVYGSFRSSDSRISSTESRYREAPRASDLLLLEGCTDRVCAGCCIAGTNRDLSCGAVGFAVVMDTVLNIALNPLDMLATLFI